MGFKEKYTTEDEKGKIENKNKKIITDEAYAVCELLNIIVNKLSEK